MNKIALLGSGHAAWKSFENIINKFNVVCIIVSDKDEVIQNLCKKKNIYYSNNISDLNLFNPNLCIMISYGKIIKQDLLDKYEFLNVHYGLLPKYRGRHTVAWALINNEKKIGYSIHKVDNGIDSGDIIFQKEITIEEKDNLNTLMNKLDLELANDINIILDQYLNGKLIPKKQDEILATYFTKRSLYDCYINWDNSTQFIINFIRALVPPYPGAFTIYNEKKIVILEAEEYNRQEYIEIPGKIINVIKNRGIVVKTRDTSILIKKIMINNEIIDADQYKFKIGEKLGINILEEYLRKYFI